MLLLVQCAAGASSAGGTRWLLVFYWCAPAGVVIFLAHMASLAIESRPADYHRPVLEPILKKVHIHLS